MSDNATTVLAGGLYLDVEWTTANIVVFAVGAFAGLFFVLTEVLDIHVPYSKFASEEARENLPLGILRSVFSRQMNNRLGFFILYFVPLVTYMGLYMYYISQHDYTLFDSDEEAREYFSADYLLILALMWGTSFTKRCLEVLFVHIYTGDIPVVSTLMIAFGYSTFGLMSLSFANQVRGYTFDPESDHFIKDVVCIALYTIGISVNFYSHLSLRWVRTRSRNAGERRYASPAEIGCLFKVFVCPHYVFEILLFLAFAMYGATALHYLTGFTVLGYLGFRTRATYKWYVSKGLIGNQRQVVDESDTKDEELAYEL